MLVDKFIYSLDIIGVIACALAATILSSRKELDIAGTILIAIVASVGGGTTRDILLGKTPVFWIGAYSYIIIIVVTSIIGQLMIKKLEKIDKILRIFDALGLAAFTIIGIEIALRYHVSAFIAVCMGAMTATFGGILRDMICNEIPLVLQKEIYITASIAGGWFYLLLTHLALPRELSSIIAITFIFSVRMFAVYKNLALPTLHNQSNKK